MAAPSGKFYPVGLQHARVYELEANGYPKATITGAVYEGVEIVAPKAYEITPAKARDIVHVGNNRRLSQDKLPAIDVSSGVIRTSRLDFDMNALLTATKVHTVGESVFTGFNTNLQGSEPAVAMLLYQQAKAFGAGTRVWSAYHLPSVVAILDPASMNENASEFAYNLAPSSVAHQIFGPIYTVALDGFTEAEMVWSETEGKPHIVAWLAAATGADGGVFLFHTDRPATASTKIHHVAKLAASGPTLTDITSTTTKTVLTQLTISGALLAGDLIICFYEHA